MFRNISTACLIGASLLLASTAAQAQATRTWVSGVGDDLNPCSRTAPCKTFAGAISKTAAGGEISVLDPGGFGALTINKSLSIVADGAEGGVLATFNTSGIIINAGVNDTVSIYGLVIEGAGTGGNGIRILAAKNVMIRKTTIRGFVSNGIDFQPTGFVKATVSESAIMKNGVGIQAKSSLSANKPRMILDRVIIENNTAAGIRGDGSQTFVRFSNSVIINNDPGLEILNSANVQSFGNNVITFNGGNETPSSTIDLQ